MGTFEKHLADIRSGEITKTNVIGIRKALNEYESRRYSRSSTAPQWTLEQVDTIKRAIDLHKPLVTGELHTSGIAAIAALSQAACQRCGNHRRP